MCPWSWPQPDMIPMMWFRQRCKWCCAPPITSYQEKHSAQESFPDCVLISASVWFYLILIFSKSIILRLDCRLFCVSHLYLPFHFYLSPLFFGGPHQFFHQIPDSIFNGVSFCSSFIAFSGKSIIQWNFCFLSTLSYSIHLPFHLMPFLLNLFFFINFLLLIETAYLLISYRRC